MLDRLIDTFRSLVTVSDADPGVPEVEDPSEHNGDAPLVVMFYADWCGFCRAFVPEFRDRVNELDVQAAAANISSRSDPRWAEYDIDTVPTLVAFRNGEPVGRVDGKPGRGLDAEDVDRVVDQVSG